MENSKIIEKINTTIDTLFKKDKWLIEKDLSEQSISHKLAEYIQAEFADYNVDCEYNGNSHNEYGRKKIIVIKRELGRRGLLRKKEEENPFDLIKKSVFPDIIIHNRGSNDNNLCIIEVKKSTNKTSFDYDKIKLSHYTTDYYGNVLKYSLGIFLLITTGTTEKKVDLQFFINGELTTFD